MTRTANTLGLYAAFGCLGYLLTGLGAVLPQLRAERGLTRVEVGLYPSAFALGLVVVGFAGHRLSRVLGRFATPVSLTALGAGAVLLATGSDRVSSAVGALVLGLGGAGLVQLVPAGLRAEHGDRAAAAIGEANAVGSSAAVFAPLIIGAALHVGLGWQLGYVGLPVITSAVLLAILLASVSRVAPADGPAPTTGGAERAPPEFRGWWVDLVLVVAVEFCVLFWAADFLNTESRLGVDAAVTFASAFVLGMALGRAVASPVTRLVASPVRLLAAAAALAFVGFVLFWVARPPAVAIAGLVVTGLGTALLYPVTLAAALAAWPGQPDRAAARCALASGIAIGVAPVALGALADAAALRFAVLLAPALLLTFLIRCRLRVSETAGRTRAP